MERAVDAMIAPQLAEWTPARIQWEGSCPCVHWCYLGHDRFVAPFFEQTIRRRLRMPFSLLFQHTTSLDALADLQSADPGLPPTGFIFHLSRCGSTLVAQMLAALPQNIVISEAPPIDAVLRAHWRDPAITDEQRIAWLRALLSVYARPRHGERHFYVKFDSWHTPALPLIRRAFPTVPWIFLYRDPLQVLVSHQWQRGAQMVPGLLPPQWLELPPMALGPGAAEGAAEGGMPGGSSGGWLGGTFGETLDEYGARVLQRICRAALQHLDGRARLINYRQLPAAVWSELAAHFGTGYTAADVAAMQEAAQFDAKNPGLTFAADSAAKTQGASADVRRLAEAWLQPVYAVLEARREQQEAQEIKGHEHA